MCFYFDKYYDIISILEPTIHVQYIYMTINNLYKGSVIIIKDYQYYFDKTSLLIKEGQTSKGNSFKDDFGGLLYFTTCSSVVGTERLEVLNKAIGNRKHVLSEFVIVIITDLLHGFNKLRI